jgi:hypothetical protein
VDLSEGRPVTFDSDGLTLEGVLHLPESTPCAGVVVAHPHPQYGGDMHNNVVRAISRAAADAGAATLRFNFRGAGASEGRYDEGRGEQRDVAAALEYMRGLPEIDSSCVALAGYSFGAAVSLRLSPPGVKCLVAVSPPASGSWLSGIQAAYGVLFVAGDGDEYCDPDELRKVAAAIGPNAQAVIHPGVDHFWAGSDDRLIETVAAFLRECL